MEFAARRGRSARMPLTRLANAVIDAVCDAPRPVADEIEKYLRSDLVFYRAEAPAGLVEKQARAWDPVLAWARDRFNAAASCWRKVSCTSPSRANPLRLCVCRYSHGAVAARRRFIDYYAYGIRFARGRACPPGARSRRGLVGGTCGRRLADVAVGPRQLALQRRAFREAEFHAAASVLILTG